ncbi:MAG: amidohydrolase family protein, partial [Flavonifractor sp.]|nr:amidohydrolase family protein [Flavonifractor sp.]
EPSNSAVYGRGYRDIGRPEVVETADHIFRDVDDLKKRYEGDGMVTVWLAPAASWGLTPELMRATRDYASRNSTPIMMHMFETGEDEQGSQARFGKSAIQWYEECGLLGPDLLAVHSVALGEAELAAYQAHRVKVSYNPVSNMYLASGIAPIPKLLELGLTVGLGTDGAGSNNSNDMLEAMKFGALLQKVASRDPQALTAEKTLRMATIEGAKALELDHLIGSIEPGKRADFFLFDPQASVKTCPVLEPISALVYAGDCRGVDTVVVNGKTLLSGGQFTEADEGAILARAQEMAEDLNQKAGPC